MGSTRRVWLRPANRPISDLREMDAQTGNQAGMRLVQIVKLSKNDTTESAIARENHRE
jgi:hypothetical protein